MSRSNKNYLVGFLFLTTLAGAGLAVSQYLELQDLRKQKRVNVTQVAPANNATAKAYLGDAPNGASATTNEAVEDAPVAIDNERAPEGGPGGGPRGRGNWGAQMATLMKNPEFAAAMRTQQRADLNRRYGDLFKQLNLPADQLDQLKDLMIERQSAMMDVMSTAASQGLNPRENREELRQLTQGLQSEIDASIRSTIGDAAYAQYESYNSTQAQRNTVNRINESLSYSNAGLTTSQSQQLVTIMASNNTGEITDQVIAQARGVLSNAQIAALQQYQAEQQARSTVRQMIRESGRQRPNRGQ